MGRRKIWVVRREKKNQEGEVGASGREPDGPWMLQGRGKVGSSREKADRANGGKQEHGVGPR